MFDSSKLPRSTLRDRMAPGIRALFVGINPGMRTWATGHHFAGPSNRFWKLLHQSGLVPQPLTPEDDVRLPEYGYGVTNLVPRPTPGIGHLSSTDYDQGRRALLLKIRRIKPAVVALVGVTLHRALFPEKRNQIVTLGLQPDTLAGARVFVLPNPSGRNASYSYAEMLQAFAKLAEYVKKVDSR